jgi:hypothetical protein
LVERRIIDRAFYSSLYVVILTLRSDRMPGMTGSPARPVRFGAIAGDQAIVTVIGAALGRFTSDLDRFDELLRSAISQLSSTGKRSPELQRIGRDLSSQNRATAEKAGLLAADAIAKEFERALEEIATETLAGGGPRYLPALEQLVALAIMRAGHERFSAPLEELASNCDEDLRLVRYAIAVVQSKVSDPPSTVAAKALVSSLVSSFETLLRSLIRLWWTLVPDALSAARQITVTEVSRYEFAEDSVRLDLDRRVQEFARRGAPAWQEALAKNPGVDLSSLARDWTVILEILARRNLLVHNEGQVDEEYRKLLTWLREDQKPPLGAIVDTDASYYQSAKRDLLGLGTSMSFAWLQKFGGGLVESVPFVKDRVYQALQDHRWHDAATIGRMVLPVLPDEEEHQELLVNIWMARRECGEDWPTLRTEIEGWKAPPTHRFHVARAALLSDARGVIAALQAWEREDPTAVRDVAGWPLLGRLAEGSAPLATYLTIRQSRKPARPRPRRRGNR